MTEPRPGARWKRRLVIVLAIGMLANSLYQCARGEPPIHYRLSLTVDDNGKLVQGSGVVEVKTFQSGGLPEASRTVFEITGEAVAVDLGSRGILFALLVNDSTRTESRDSQTLLPFYFGIAKRKSGKIEPADVDRIKHEKPLVDLPFAKLPMLVRFRDVNDPKTIERVEPNDLAASFGPGVKLVRATIEITDDPVTTGLSKVLPWLVGGYPETRLFPATGGPVSEVPRLHLLTFSAFSCSRE